MSNFFNTISPSTLADETLFDRDIKADFIMATELLFDLNSKLLTMHPEVRALIIQMITERSRF